MTTLYTHDVQISCCTRHFFLAVRLASSMHCTALHCSAAITTTIAAFINWWRNVDRSPSPSMQWTFKLFSIERRIGRRDHNNFPSSTNSHQQQQQQQQVVVVLILFVFEKASTRFLLLRTCPRKPRISRKKERKKERKNQVDVILRLKPKPRKQQIESSSFYSGTAAAAAGVIQQWAASFTACSPRYTWANVCVGTRQLKR